MKRKREIIPFLIAALLGILLLCSAFVSFNGTPKFNSPAQYLNLFIKDTLFAKALFLSVCLPFLCTLAICAVITAFFLLKGGIRKLYYILTSAASLAASFAFYIISGGKSLLLMLSFSLIISTVTVFLCWLFEPLTLKKRSYENK